jgi:hypothetical protein
VPAANVAIVMVPGIIVALVCRHRPGAIGVRIASLLFAMLANWGPLFRLRSVRRMGSSHEFRRRVKAWNEV